MFFEMLQNKTQLCSPNVLLVNFKNKEPRKYLEKMLKLIVKYFTI